MSFSFEKTIASRGYHIYKNTWSKAKVDDKVVIELEKKKESLDIDPYACAVQIKNKYFEHLINVGQMLREITRHVHFLIKTDSESVHGYIESLVYTASPIPARGLEIPLQLTFSCPKKIPPKRLTTGSRGSLAPMRLTTARERWIL